MKNTREIAMLMTMCLVSCAKQDVCDDDNEVDTEEATVSYIEFSESCDKFASIGRYDANQDIINVSIYGSARDEVGYECRNEANDVQYHNTDSLRDHYLIYYSTDINIHNLSLKEENDVVSIRWIDGESLMVNLSMLDTMVVKMPLMN